MPSATLAVADKERQTLESWTRSSTVSAGQRERAEIVLAIAGGDSVSGAARRLGVSRPTVIKWRDRFATDGMAGLGDQPRSGRPKTVDDAQIIAATLDPPPAKLAVTHWSSRLLARQLGIGDATVARAWRAYRVQPWRQGTFKFSTDPELEAKVRDVVGLYLDPPRNAIVLCVDEKSQIQALNRTQPILPVRPGLPEKATHDYKRNGTTTLFAALNVATGTVTDRCYDRHGKAEFLDFLKLVAKAYPRRKLHVVLDNYHTHKHQDINRWLEKNSRITLHFTPTSGSWMNLVEVFFGIITRQAIRRGSFDNVAQLNTAIRAFIAGYNDRCQPFVWTKTADEILPRATRQPTSDARDTRPYEELSQSRMGSRGDNALYLMLVEELEKRDLVRPSQDGVSIPMHPLIRNLILVLLSQILRPAGARAGLDLCPATDVPSVHAGLAEFLAIDTLPSAAHVVDLDLQVVGVNLASAGLDDIMRFREVHAEEYRTYARDVRGFMRQIAALPEPERETARADRSAELADRALSLQAASRQWWKRPAGVMLGLAGAGWTIGAGDIVGGLFAIGAGVAAAVPGPKPQAEAFSYLFQTAGARW
jgi:transposase